MWTTYLTGRTCIPSTCCLWVHYYINNFRADDRLEKMDLPFISSIHLYESVPSTLLVRLTKWSINISANSSPVQWTHIYCNVVMAVEGGTPLINKPRCFHTTSVRSFAEEKIEGRLDIFVLHFLVLYLGWYYKTSKFSTARPINFVYSTSFVWSFFLN